MKRKNTCGLVGAVLALTMMVSGCQVGNRDIVVMNAMSNKQVFQIDGEECSLKEAEVYLCNYSNLYGTAYTIDLWQHDFGENSLEDYVKDITLEELTRVYCMDLLAESQQVALNDEEKKLLDEKVGFVEASIGRMVPVQTDEMKGDNPLRVCVESYGTLPVDKDAFKGEIPPIKNMVPFSPFQFFIERKLFIHNMGHAFCAYLGCLKGVDYIWQSIGDPYVELLVMRAMQQSAISLAVRHNVPYIELNNHVEDLIKRFGNKQLGDTVKRVGNDLNRKLNPNDRIIGALNMCVEQGITPKYLCLAAAAAMNFKYDEVSNRPCEEILTEICKIDPQSDAGKLIITYYNEIKSGKTPEELCAMLRG